MANVTFTDGMDKVLVEYPSLNGKKYKLSVRKGYITAGICDLIPIDTGHPGADGPFPKNSHPNYLWIAGTLNTKLHRRRVPVSVAKIVTPGTIADGVIDTMTGVVVHGFTGERQKA